jgi:hypothetical protein
MVWMARLSLCDCCQKEITEENPLVAKLYFTPWNGVPKESAGHHTYSSKLDIGKCCIVKVHQLGKWTPRKKVPALSKAAQARKKSQSQRKTPQGGV